jgi:hypothetical protein
MTIDIGHGRLDTIDIYARDDPYKLAYDFCKKNNLEI